MQIPLLKERDRSKRGIARPLRFPPLSEREEALRAPRSVMASVQAPYLKQALRVAWEEVPFYQRLWQKRRCKPERRPRQFAEWPTWNVADLRDAIAEEPPFGGLYVPWALENLHFVNSSTGTTGAPRLVAMTNMDVPGLSDVYGRHYQMTGVGRTDVCCVTWTFATPSAAWSAMRASMAVGAAVVPASSGRVTPSEKLLDLIRDTGTTVLAGGASYLMHVADQGHKKGYDLAASPVRLLFLSGEAAPAHMRKQLQEAWGARAVLCYANSDTSWVAIECAESTKSLGELGAHIFEDVTRVDILDEDGQPVQDGEYAELVITSWARSSSPRIRFRTGDRAAVSSEPCPCGRTAPRLLPLHGRVDDAVRFHGQTIWPVSMESALQAVFGRSTEYYLERREGGEVLALVVEAANPAAVDRDHVALNLQQKLNVRFEVEVAELGATASRTGAGKEMKVRRLFDRDG